MSSQPDTRASAALAAVLNVPDTFTYRGQEYRVGDLALRYHEEYSQWLRKKAVRDAWDGTADLPEPARKLWISVVSGDINTGMYDVGGDLYFKSLTSVSGMVQALWLGLRQEDPSIPRAHAVELVRAALTERQTAIRQAMERAAVPVPK